MAERKPACFMLSVSVRFSIFSPSQSCGEVTQLGRPTGWPSLEALYPHNHACFFCLGLFAFPGSPIFLYVPCILLHRVFFKLLCLMSFKLGTIPLIYIASASLPPASLPTFSCCASFKLRKRKASACLPLHGSVTELAERMVAVLLLSLQMW